MSKTQGETTATVGGEDEQRPGWKTWTAAGVVIALVFGGGTWGALAISNNVQQHDREVAASVSRTRELQTATAEDAEVLNQVEAAARVQRNAELAAADTAAQIAAEQAATAAAAAQPASTETVAPTGQPEHAVTQRTPAAPSAEPPAEPAVPAPSDDPGIGPPPCFLCGTRGDGGQ